MMASLWRATMLSAAALLVLFVAGTTAIFEEEVGLRDW
jgi:hypothetical protein